MPENCYCRTCLSTQNLNPIFEEGKDAESRSKDLFLVTGVTIEKNDEFSQFICKLCLALVNDSLKLRTNSQKADQILKRSQPKYKRRKETVNSRKGSKKTVPNKKKLNRKRNLNEELKKQEEITHHECNEVKIKEEIIIEEEDSKEKINISKNDNLKNENKHQVKYEIDIKCENVADNPLSNSDNANLIVKSENVDTNKDETAPKRKRMTKEEIQKYMSLAVQPVAKDGPVRCALCHRVLREKRFFVSHAKTHFAAEHVCESCGKRYTSRNTLRYHRQRVHAARRFACARCAYRAADRIALENHTRIVHTGERPFGCHECGDTFTVKSTLVQHMRKHFGRYDVQCERCPAQFRSKSELASHRNKVHLMRYTYYCHLCPGQYRAVATVKNHIVKVHGVPRDQHPPIKCVKTRRLSDEEQAKVS